MKELIEKLKVEHDKYNTLYLSIADEKEQIDSNINSIISKLDNPTTLEEKDIDFIMSQLDESLVLTFKKMIKFIKLIDKFPNQPQVKETIKLIDDVKKCIIDKIIEENKITLSKYEEYKNNKEFLEYIINILEYYTETTYISAKDLFKLISFIEYDDNILEFYLKVLKNNNLLSSEEEDNNVLDIESENFIHMLKKINNSISSKTYELDDTIRRNLSILLEEEFFVDLEDNLIELMSEDFKPEELKLLKFIIHLHKNDIELSDSQDEYLLDLYRFYDKRINEVKNDDTAQNNYELIELLNDEYKFTNIELLKKVFSSNDIDNKLKLIIICSIIKNNSKKELKKKNQEFDSPIELFKSYGIDVTLIDSYQINTLNKNIDNVNEVTNVLMKYVPDFLPTLLEDIITIEMIISILSYSSSVIINKLVKVCDEEGLNFEEVIKNNPFVLMYKNKSHNNLGLYESFLENIKFFKEKNIDLNAAFDALFEEHTLVKGRYNILTNLYNIDVIGNEFLLSDATAICNIDRFIEIVKNGYKFITSNLHLLKDDCSLLIYAILSSPNVITIEDDKYIINEPLYEKIKAAIRYRYSDKVDVVGTTSCWNSKYDYYDSFFIETYTKDNYIRKIIHEECDQINEKIFENYYIKQLENPKNKFKKNDYTYVINGTTISRIKFLRACSFLCDTLEKKGETFDLPAIKYALRFGLICLEKDERNIENFSSYSQPNTSKPKTKKKKK